MQILVLTGYFHTQLLVITAWGGRHMAIRAGEQQVPAVIGVGEVLYHQWSTSMRLMIDCAEQRVEIKIN